MHVCVYVCMYLCHRLCATAKDWTAAKPLCEPPHRGNTVVEVGDCFFAVVVYVYMFTYRIYIVACQCTCCLCRIHTAYIGYQRVFIQHK